MINFFRWKKKKTVLPLEAFSKEDKLVIAEFTHAYETDTLIKSEGEKVIKMFDKLGIPEAKTTPLETFAILNLIRSHTEAPDRWKIRDEYYGGKL